MYIATNSPGILRVVGEMVKQNAKWGTAHDDQHTGGELAWRAGELICMPWPPLFDQAAGVSERDAWGLCEKTKGDRIRQLEIGLALGIQELDRLLRAAG